MKDGPLRQDQPRVWAMVGCDVLSARTWTSVDPSSELTESERNAGSVGFPFSIVAATSAGSF